MMLEMIAPELFSAFSLRDSPHGEGIMRILAAAIQAVEPAAAVHRHVNLQGNILRIGKKTYDLEVYGRIFLIGMGKAAPAMAQALDDLLGDRISTGLIVTKEIPPGFLSRLPIMEAGHPVPDELSLRAGEKITQLLDNLKATDLVLCLISGGASALVASPYPGIDLKDIQKLTSVLLACGARIDEVNTLRRKLDRLKGGGLAHHSVPAQLVSLILSDVVGDPLEAIASGPTVFDPTSTADAIKILEKYHIKGQIPASIINFLGLEHENLSWDGSDFEKIQNIIIANNLQSAQAALAQAKSEGYNTYLLRTDLQGEAREVAHELCNNLRWAWQRHDPLPPPACILAGGETTVTLRGNGQGGRNLELALSAVSDLADFPKVMLISLATDGQDGNTDSAGAVVTGDSFKRGTSLGLHPTTYLEDNDSFAYFSALGDLLKPVVTGTNVNDLTFLFTFE